MKNYQMENIGKLNQVEQYTFAPEGVPISIPGKLFMKERLNITSMEISVNQVAPGEGMSFFHRHKNNEEVYFIISGKGEMFVDDETFLIDEGSVVCIKPEAKRSWWNTGDVPLIYLVMQAPMNGLVGATLSDGEIMEGAVPWG